GTEAAGNVFGRDGFARQNSIAAEELKGEGVGGFGRSWSAFSSLLRAEGKQRPAALRVGRRSASRAENDACLQSTRSPCALWSKNVGAESVERVVGDEAAPDQAPECIDGFAWIAAAYC